VRPYWKGYLKLALVSCPIALHAACSTAERIRFRQVNKATGNRLRQQFIDEETGAPVGPEHKARGYEVGKGEYLVVSEEELDAIEIASTHTSRSTASCRARRSTSASSTPPITSPRTRRSDRRRLRLFVRPCAASHSALTNARPRASMSTSWLRSTTTLPSPCQDRPRRPTWLTETRLRGWACKTRTQKRRRKISL
jgi:hypothetical protein